MAYITESQVRARAALVTQPLQKSAGWVLKSCTASVDETFDVFLSHSSAEPEEILLGVKAMLEDVGLSVYVDKYSDPHLSPDKVTIETAEVLRGRMRQSNTLLYIYSQHSQKSRWMPWELGFFDGIKGDVGVLPVTLNQEETFKGEEYLNLYPYVDAVPAAGAITKSLWINKGQKTYAQLRGWARKTEAIRKRD